MTQTSSTRPLSALENTGAFIGRHIGPDEAEIRAMLTTLGVTSLDALISQTVPERILTDEPLQVGPARTEEDVAANAAELAGENQVMRSMIGMGYYDTHTPAIIRRNVLENPGWYTAYTPYQAEVSQGRMQALLNYQQMVMDLTGMELANASLLDEGTAAAEAMAMARRVAKSKSDVFIVDADCHPQTIAIINTRARLMGIEVIIGDAAHEATTRDAFGVLMQYPGSSGSVTDISTAIDGAHERNALAIVASDLLALTQLKSPGEMGADVVLGSAQRFGVPMGYGGPHAAFFATRDQYKRSTPGRIIGVSVDANGNTALRMALQTREQHIRRDKATSNICTAQVLLAIMSGFYGVYHGPDGVRQIGERVHRLACIAADVLRGAGHTIQNTQFFDTLTVNTPGRADEIVQNALSQGINLRHVDADHVGFSFDETTTRVDVLGLIQAFGCTDAVDLDAIDATVSSTIPPELSRTTEFMTHGVFNRYRSETEMLRYLRKLQSMDIALDRAMIPLGSCTMKLNATTEMEPVTLPGFAGLHPFAPLDQAQGYARLFKELEQDLCDITGYDALSLQPNAGSQGEYAGLLCIRKYHESRDEAHRDICLIPSSAHGTNPASAVMAGMQVVVVKCDDDGNVDIDDLRARAEAHSDRLGALMVTYPSTHGVFEEAIIDVCDIVHQHGGQVYMDGANLNALVGIVKPGHIGSDVSHLNLHKTFCIPHGGGGPGMGPIGVKQHLAEFLPDHPIVGGVNPDAGQHGTLGTVSAAPWGSAAILPISWAYIKMMGSDGLTHATKVAIASANYMAHRLGNEFPVVYTGANGRVAHECIIDLGPIKEATGISVEDVAKRLVDYGFHAPTMSWPVADSLMIEPTESESKVELDRFCDAMILIRQEIADIELGKADPENNVLRNAPHSASLLADDSWERPYSRQRAFFPLPGQSDDKYWPPVGRVDNVHGDRNLVCSCPPLSDYAEEVA